MTRMPPVSVEPSVIGSGRLPLVISAYALQAALLLLLNRQNRVNTDPLNLIILDCNKVLTGTKVELYTCCTQFSEGMRLEAWTRIPD